ncbi:hypothetical protein CFC21_019712 [Triticum aestivum]|uniref:RING-type domain-containing protein n=2 Tax=Triticum aestivum TaxID=4565 RepID=A0A3B6B7R5_WHEAT|nr:hypothetical protein CFC21_019712 [Triticum aestivum]
MVLLGPRRGNGGPRVRGEVSSLYFLARGWLINSFYHCARRVGVYLYCLETVELKTCPLYSLRPETFLVSPRIDGMFITDGEGDPPVDGNQHTTMDMDTVPDILKVSVDSSETRRERGSSPMPRPQPRDPMLIADSNGDSPVDGHHAYDGRGELFYCPMCMETAPIILKSRFGSCDDHVFCSSCVAKYVAVKQRQDVALPVECPDCKDDASLNSDGEGNEDSPADGDGKRFYCAKCMHVVPCACIRPSFTSCAHDLCSSCVSQQLQGRRRQAGKLPRHQPADLLPKPKGNGDLPVDVDGELLDCAICMELVPGTLRFRVNSCAHAFCSSCVAQYIAAKLDDMVARIECPHPGCEDGAVEPESCHGIIPTDLLDKWGLLLCELAVGAKSNTGQEDVLPVPGMLGAPARRQRGGVPALPPAFLRPVRRAVARRLGVRRVPEARAGRARPGGPLAPASRRQGGLAAVPRVPDVRGEIGRVQLHQMQVWIQLLLPMRIRVVRAKPLLQQVQALISTVWLAMEGRFLPPTTT